MQGSVNPASVVFITHVLDPEIITILEESTTHPVGSETMVAAIINQTSMPTDVKESSTYYFNSIREKGGKVVLVDSPESISEALRDAE